MQDVPKSTNLLRLYARSKTQYENNAPTSTSISLNEKQGIAATTRYGVNEKNSDNANVNSVNNAYHQTMHSNGLFVETAFSDTLATTNNNNNNNQQSNTTAIGSGEGVTVHYNAYGGGSSTVSDDVLSSNQKTGAKGTGDTPFTQPKYKVRSGLGTPLLTPESEYDESADTESDGNKRKRPASGTGTEGPGKKPKILDAVAAPERDVRDDHIKRLLFESFRNAESLMKDFAYKYISFAGGGDEMLGSLIKIIRYESVESDMQDYKSLLGSIYRSDIHLADQLKANVGLALMDLYKKALKESMNGTRYDSDHINESAINRLFGDHSSALKNIDDLVMYYLSKSEMPGSVSQYNEETFANYTGPDGTKLDVLSVLNRRRALKERLKSRVKDTIAKYPHSYVGDATFVFTDLFKAKITNALNLLQLKARKKFTLKQILSSPVIDTMFVALMNYLDKNTENSRPYMAAMSDPFNAAGTRSGSNIADRITNNTYTGSDKTLRNPATNGYNRGGNITVINGRASAVNTAAANQELVGVLEQFRDCVVYDLADENKLVYISRSRNNYFGYGYGGDDSAHGHIHAFEQKQKTLLSDFEKMISHYDKLIILHEPKANAENGTAPPKRGNLKIIFPDGNNQNAHQPPFSRKTRSGVVTPQRFQFSNSIRDDVFFQKPKYYANDNGEGRNANMIERDDDYLAIAY